MFDYILVKFTLHNDKGLKLMKKFIDAILCKDLPVRDLKNANKVNLLAFAWAGTLAISTICAEYTWYDAVLPITIAFVVHMGIGLAMVFSYRKFLIELDEMERKIQQDALVLSVGVTIIGFSSYSILEGAGVVSELSPSSLIVLMALAYMTGIIIGRIRYL